MTHYDIGLFYGIFSVIQQYDQGQSHYISFNVSKPI